LKISIWEGCTDDGVKDISGLGNFAFHLIHIHAL
jgi:hypothetical protein